MDHLPSEKRLDVSISFLSIYGCCISPPAHICTTYADTPKKIINCDQKTFQCQKPVLELIDSLQSTNTRLLVCDDLSSFLDVSVKEIIDLFTAQGCFL